MKPIPTSEEIEDGLKKIEQMVLGDKKFKKKSEKFEKIFRKLKKQMLVILDECGYEFFEITLMGILIDFMCPLDNETRERVFKSILRTCLIEDELRERKKTIKDIKDTAEVIEDILTREHDKKARESKESTSYIQ